MGCAVTLAWTSEREALPGTDGQSRFVGVPRKRVLSAPRDNTWSHVLRPVLQVKNSSLVPIGNSGRRGRCTTEGLRHYNLDQSRSVRGTGQWVQFLRSQHAMSRFSCSPFTCENHSLGMVATLSEAGDPSHAGSLLRKLFFASACRTSSFVNFTPCWCTRI